MVLKFTNMVRLLFFIFVIIIIGGSEGLGVMPLREYEVVHVVDNHNTCSRHEARLCVDAFVNCFVNRKYRNRSNLFNIVPRLLDRSKTCIKFANRKCRPSYDGFIRIMGKVIDMIKAYSSTHVERLVNVRIITNAERDKIKDLKCVENSLTKETYTTCFDSVISTYEDLLNESETYDLIFQKEVEKAIICTNIANTQCSKSVKIDLNKIVRYILGVRHTETEDIQNDRMSSEIPTPNEPSKLPTEIRKTGQENIDNDFETPELPDSTSPPNSTDFTVIEQKEIEVVLKIKRPSESPDFPEEKIGEPKPKNVGLHSHETEPTPFTERTTFPEPTTFTDPPEPEKENSENDTKLPEETEITVTPVSSELSTSTEFPESPKLFNSSKSLNPIRKDNDSQFTEPPQLLKTTQSSKQNVSDSIGLDDSKDIAASEKGKDIIIDLSDWEEESAVFTEPPQPLMTTESPNLKDLQNFTIFNASTDRVASETKEDIIIDLSDDEKSTTLTDPPLLLMTTESPKLTDLPNSTGLDASKGRVTAGVEEDITVDLSHEEISTTLTDHHTHPELLMTTESPKIKDLRNSTSLDASKGRVTAGIEEDITVDLSDEEISTTLTDHHTHPELLMTTESPKIKDLRNSTGLDAPKDHTAAETGKDIVTESVAVDWDAKSTASTKLPKPSDLPRSTASAVSLKLTDFPKSTASTKLPKPADLPKSIAPTRSPKPTDLPKSTSSTKSPKPPDLPKSTAATTPRKTTVLPKSTAPTTPRKTTVLPKSTASTTPRKTTVLPKSTTTTRRPTPPAPVQLRSRNTPYEPPRPTEAPKHWYDFIVQPFVSLWRTIKSWFGY